MGQDEWLELESDPGLFTLLVEDLGVKGVQVDEIYELSKVPSDPVLGFIFLFRWQQNEKKSIRRSSRGGSNSLNTSQASSTGGDNLSNSLSTPTGNTSTPGKVRNSLSNDVAIPATAIVSAFEESGENYLFFAHQIVPNSCATHSLLSILMNTSHQSVNLGPLLTEFQKATKSLSPNIRGLAIGFMPPLLEAHNRHARGTTDLSFQSTFDKITSTDCVQLAVEAAKKAANEEVDATSTSVLDTSTSNSVVDQGDTFHFVCFVPVGRFLYELDGLKQEPINHGLLEDPITHSGWTRQCLELLRQRMKDQDVRYNLMAVVPDRRVTLTSWIETLEKNRAIVEKSIQQLTCCNSPAVAIKLEHNGDGGSETFMTSKTDSPDVQCHLINMKIKSESTPNEYVKHDAAIDCEFESGDGEEGGGRPVTRSASRAAAEVYKQPPSQSTLKRNSSRNPNHYPVNGGASISRSISIHIDLTEGDLSTSSSTPTTNNNAFVDDNSQTSSATPTDSLAFETGGETTSTRHESTSPETGMTVRRRPPIKESSTPVACSPPSVSENDLRQSKYPTRSSTKRDTLASHSLANTRLSMPQTAPALVENLKGPPTTAFLTPENLTQLLENIDARVRDYSAALAEEEARRYAYRVDSARRIHNYEPFIRKFLSELMVHGKLQQLILDASVRGVAGGELKFSLPSTTGRQLRKRKSVSNTPQKASWSSSSSSSSSALSASASSTGSTLSSSHEVHRKAHSAAAGGALSRLAVRRARLTAVANRPSTRMSTASSPGVSKSTNRRTSRRPL